ncbi:hypothetical protein HN858_03025 [Candidatus Falkowbacteria bacterium]|jgi:hypothetical protein|nr:hypothetical protein [Candidatus Falkowbacteria bacterium]MBT5502930.1 hypothetical protein [Candidatus Falkowbacteria bacterium]MBT6574057.1 hypothetical protein [Candidatus Falkowbacteria bacterium]MBT7348626.1 hypothetical protein [Candidatus Falkowbacteria bacterium]MBT7500417.1 hypothetical protein [Candidatus Falkowbacteria bacterium]
MLSIGMIFLIVVSVFLLMVAFVVFRSVHFIEPNEIGLVTKNFSLTGRKTEDDCPVAFLGEAGFQAKLLMPGWRFKFWPVFTVEKHPWVQVPAGEVGVVISQVGKPLPLDAKSGIYKEVFGNFSNLKGFVENGGEKGVQRPVLPPGTLAPVHPLGFLVLTKCRVYGVPVDTAMQNKKNLKVEDFGLEPDQLNVVLIRPKKIEVGPRNEMDHHNHIEQNRKVVDMVGVITTYEGKPLSAGDIAGRIGDFSEIDYSDAELDDKEIIEKVLGTQNEQHDNYQNFQKFLDLGGRIGLQHDPILYGAYNFNPFLISVERVPMLVVQQGEVAVIKAYVGRPSKDISGHEFKFGSLVRPGCQGIWSYPLRTGKYPINPRCYEAEVVKTYILTLNWANATSDAHDLDSRLCQIEAKSREGFIFKLDLQVQIHVPDTKAPKVISIVGTIQNLVNEVLQAAVGNHFRDKLQSIPAIKFIETRQQVQEEAFEHIKTQLAQYEIETKGVFIQDVVLPADMVKVLTQREIAHQEIETFKKQTEAQVQRIETERQRGIADQQAELARSKVSINIKENEASARKKQADGEATFISEVGAAEASKTRDIGLAKGESYQKQVEALGQMETAMVNAVQALAEAGTKIVPDTLVVSGGGSSGSFEGLAATLMKYVGSLKTQPSGGSIVAPKKEKKTTSRKKAA